MTSSTRVFEHYYSGIDAVRALGLCIERVRPEFADQHGPRWHLHMFYASIDPCACGALEQFLSIIAEYETFHTKVYYGNPHDLTQATAVMASSDDDDLIAHLMMLWD